MSFVLFKDSFERYKAAGFSDPALLANLRQRYTQVSATNSSIDDTGGLSNGRREAFLGAGGGLTKALPHSARWVIGFRYKWSASSLSNGVIYQLLNNNVPLFNFEQNADGTLLIRAGNGSGSTGVIGVSDRSLFSNTRYYLEIDITLAGGTPVTATGELRINGSIVVASGSQSAGVNASSLLSGDATGNLHAFNPAQGGLGTGSWITDIYVKNEAGYEGDIRNYPLYPASDGGELDWTPNSGSTHYDRVNTHPVDVTKWLSTATPGDIDLWGFDALPSFSGAIVGINISVLVQKDDEGTKSFKIVVGSTGTDAESDEFFVSSANPEYYEFSLKEDPTTSMPWTQAAINALIAGVKCIS